MAYSVHWHRSPLSTLTFKRFATSLRLVAGPQEVGDHLNGIFLHGTNDPHPGMFLTYPQEEGARWCDTRRRQPYTACVMKACILLVEYGGATNLSDDDSDWRGWLTALEDVHAKVGLRTYEFQKKYFEDFVAASKQLSPPAQELLGRIHGMEEENLALRTRVRELETLNQTLLEAVQSPEDVGAMRRLTVALATRVLKKERC